MDFRFPISVKGIVFRDKRVILLKNDRDEWELPGGRLKPDEKPEACVVREIMEELGLSVGVASIVDAWVYEVFLDKRVFIITYLCTCHDFSIITISNEHTAFDWFPLEGLDHINMPKGYKQSIRKAMLIAQ